MLPAMGGEHQVPLVPRSIRELLPIVKEGRIVSPHALLAL